MPTPARARTRPTAFITAPDHLAVAAALPNAGQAQLTLTQANAAQITGRLEPLA